MDVLIDFDGSCTTHDFPEIGKDIGSVPILKKLVENGHRLILFTMRSHRPYINPDGSERDTLQEAIDWFGKNDIPLYGINTNPTQSEWTDSPKAYGQLLIDDIALGMVLKIDRELSTRPFIDWFYVELMLKNSNLI